MFYFNRPLKRMTVGMVLAAIAFVCAALVQIEIDVSRQHLFVCSIMHVNLGIKLFQKPVSANTRGVQNKDKCSFVLLYNFSENIAHFPISVPESVETA